MDDVAKLQDNAEKQVVEESIWRNLSESRSDGSNGAFQKAEVHIIRIAQTDG